jgi:hypothetical protein
MLAAFRALAIVGLLAASFATLAADKPSTVRSRRILYNLDGDSCITLKAGRKGPGPITTNDLVQLVQELTFPGSQVSTFLLCVNAQVTYYPTRVGTQRGDLSTPEEQSRWSPHEQQRRKNIQEFFNAGVDPYAFLFAEARRRGLETLITFRMNDAHGNDFLRTAFWRDHPEYRLPNGGLDFSHAAVRDYVFRLIEEAVLRYDTDGLELDFQRFPVFFPANASESAVRRLQKIHQLVERVRELLDQVGTRRGKRLVLAARPPTNQDRGTPTYYQSIAKGCDPGEWARRGWIDFLSVSEWLFTANSLDLDTWRDQIAGIPLYAGIQPETQPSPDDQRCEFCLGADGYRRTARRRWAEGADGIYLFNFFTTREWPQPLEPPFEVLAHIGSPDTLANLPVPNWETNAPIARVSIRTHQKHPAPRTAAMTAVQYVGPAFERREWRAVESKDDVADQQTARWTLNNGRTWSDWVPQQPSSLVDYAGVQVWEGGWADFYDPASKLLVQAWLRQIQQDRLYHCFSYIRTSADLGRTWAKPTPLRYEAGPEFDPSSPTNAAFLHRNEGYPGNNFARLPDGSLVLALAHANAPGDPKNNERPWRMGSVLFRGTWNFEDMNYSWAPGARLEISPDQSARGLMEPEIAVLKDGRLLVVWRGSNTGWDGTQAKEPGRKWFSISEDGGRTLAPVQEWRYSDGNRFYSPSSIHRMIRHSQTGRLYWIGNITMQPPAGNHPRHPLVIAEVDESKAALKRDTVTLLAERKAYQGPQVQFSNFSLLEDRETHDLELYLTTYGQEPDPADWATADSVQLRVDLLAAP